MVKTSVMGVTRCRICRFEMGTVAGGQGSGGPGTTASCRPCGRDRGGVGWWAEAALSNGSKIAGASSWRAGWLQSQFEAGGSVHTCRGPPVDDGGRLPRVSARAQI
jgi:hypothetical protein